MGYADFKNKMKSQQAQETLTSAFEEKSYEDARYWKPTIDKNGNANCVIRFLPAGGDEEVPYVTMFSYAFKDDKTNQWYIENSLQTIGLEDPVAQKNSELWATGDELNQAIVRKRRRNQKFIGNVLIIKDPANPENEGKVMLYKYGKAIMNKIKEAIKPQFADEKPINPFDLWEGADFRLRIFKDTSNGYPSYEKCVFDSPSAVFDGDDERIEQEVYNNLYPLQPEIAPSKFKTYEKLKERLALVEGRSVAEQQRKQEERRAPNPDFEDDAPAKSAPASKAADIDEVEVDPELMSLLED